MKSSILKLLVLLVVMTSMVGCATAPSVVSDFKKGDVAFVTKPTYVIVRNEHFIQWGDVGFISGSMCRLRSDGSVDLWGIAKRPGDYERTFFFDYYVSEGVSHDEEDCPSGTRAIMGEGKFVGIMSHDIRAK